MNYLTPKVYWNDTIAGQQAITSNKKQLLNIVGVGFIEK